MCLVLYTAYINTATMKVGKCLSLLIVYTNVAIQLLDIVCNQLVQHSSVIPNRHKWLCLLERLSIME